MQAVAHVAIPTDDQEPDPPVRKKKSRRSARDAEIAVAPVVDPEVAPETLEAVVRAEVIEAAELDEPPRKDRTKKKSLEEVAQAVEPEPRRGRKGKRPVEPREVEAEVDPEAVEAISSDAPEAEHELEAREGATDEAVAAGEAGDEVALTEGAGVAEGGEVAEGAEGIEGIEGVEATEGVEAAEAPSGAVEGEAEVEGVASLPTSAASLDAEGLKQLVEALVFASDKPMTVQRLRQLTRVSDIPRLEQALVDLAADYADRGIVLQQVSGGYQFRTRTQWSQWVQQLIAGRPVRLTRAQLETLAIVAYRQPITRPEIDDIRGVDSSATLKLLMDRQLIRILGKKEEVGRPMLYGTTKEFLDFFSLGDLRELPTLREYSELTPESRQVITDRLGDLPDDGGEGGEGSSGPLGEGGAGGDPSADASGLGAAPEPTAADLIAAYVAELDADAASAPPHVVLDVVEGDDRAGEPGEDILTYAASSAATDEADGPVADPETIADDAAHLAEAILAMDPPSAATVDASSTGAELASAGLANDAAELADAILGTPAITDELAFDLSDARDGAVEVEVEVAVTELHAGSLVELDPFAAEVPAAVASVGDAFVGESLVGSPELDAPVDPMLADGSSGVAVEAELASAAPHVGLDEWPGGSGGLAASAAHDDAEGELPPLGDSDVDAATAATDGSDVVIDPVE